MRADYQLQVAREFVRRIHRGETSSVEAREPTALVRQWHGQPASVPGAAVPKPRRRARGESPPVPARLHNDGQAVVGAIRGSVSSTSRRGRYLLQKRGNVDAGGKNTDRRIRVALRALAWCLLSRASAAAGRAEVRGKPLLGHRAQ